MPELGGFAEIAPYLTHPLVLAGFGLLLFFGLLRAVLKSGIVPTVSRTVGGRALLQLLRYGFVVALVVIVLGFALAFFRTERETVDVDRIIQDYAAARQEAAAEKAAHQSTLTFLARLSEFQDSGALRDAVRALVKQANNPDAPRGTEQAIELLRQGQTGKAEAVLAEILDRRLQERASASAEAAEAARHLGAIAYLDDTRKAIEAYRLATELDPDDVWSWILLGRLHQRAGYLASAEHAFERARDAAGRAGDQRDLGVAYHELGVVRQANGDLTGALEAYERFRGTAERLAARDPGNTEWQRDLSVSHEKIGDVRTAQGDLAGALKAYGASLAIAERLAASDPGNAGWQRDLSVSHNKIGDVRTAQGDLAGALDAYGARLAIAERLAAQDPGNTEWQRDLSVSHERIGNVRTAQGELAGALKAYGASLAIRERLAAQDPGNAQWQRDLIVSHVKLAMVAGGEASAAEALRHYEAALTIARDLAGSGRLAPADAWMVGDLEARLEGVNPAPAAP